MSNIIDGSNKPDKKNIKVDKKIIIVATSVIAVILLAVSVFMFFKPSNNNQAEDPVYEQIKESMNNKGIEYTKEDYSKDKEILEKSVDENGNLNISEENMSNLSNAYQESLSANQTALNAANELTGTQVKTPNEVQSYITTKVSNMTSFINNSYGWPKSGDYADESYDAFREYISQLDKYACYGTSMENWYEDQFTLDYQATLIRYSAYNQEQYSISNNAAKGHDSLLKNWYAVGHPGFGNIYDCSLEQNDIQLDNTISNLQARIVTDSGSYLVYLNAYNSDSESKYELVDIKQL